MQRQLSFLCLFLAPVPALAKGDIGQVVHDLWRAYDWLIILSIVISIGPYIVVSIWASVQDSLEARARREKGGPPQNPDPNSIKTIYNQYDPPDRKK